jgi:molecular chaperone GrpE
MADQQPGAKSKPGSVKGNGHEPEQSFEQPGGGDQPEPTVDVEAQLGELGAALEQARLQADELKDQALRARAEVENVRRRAQREIENAHKYALEKFAAELLPVLDSLERAVESCRSQSDAGAAAAIAEGVELSLKLFLDALGRAGIQQVDPLGKPFDPQRHEAMTMVETGDAEPGSVVQVLQKGYVLNERLVRPAMVMVARAPSGGTPGGPAE